MPAPWIAAGGGNNANGMSNNLYYQQLNAPAPWAVTGWTNGNHQFYGCDVLNCYYGVNVPQSSFYWNGGVFSGNWLDWWTCFTGPTVIQGIKSSNSGWFISCNPNVISEYTVSIKDVVFNTLYPANVGGWGAQWMDIPGDAGPRSCVFENVRNTSVVGNAWIRLNQNGGLWGPNCSFKNFEQPQSMLPVGIYIVPGWWWHGFEITVENYVNNTGGVAVNQIPRAHYTNGNWSGVLNPGPIGGAPGTTSEPNNLQLSTNAARLLFGANADANLYRSGVNNLVTDGILQASGGLISGGAVQSYGLNGAQNASRYVGGTATGPPAGGTFQVGDFVISALGAVWVCTVAGSPGTWVNISATKTYWAQTANATVYPSNGSIWQVLNGTLINFTLAAVSDVVVTCIMAGMINVANTAVNAQWRLGINIDGATQGAMSYFVGANSGVAQSGSLTATQKVASMAAGAHTAQAVCWWNGTANGAQYYMGTCHAVVSTPSGG